MKIHVLVLTALLLFSCSEKTAKPENVAPKAVPVETLSLTVGTFVESVDVSGVTRPEHEVRVAAESPGRVLKAPLVEGGTVQKGDLILKVDSQVDSARVDVISNQVAVAQREFERTKMLAREGLATPQQLDQAASAVDAARLGMKQAKVGIGKTSVRSPISGTVAQKFVEEGEYVMPGAPLVHIVDYSTVVIEASVAESDVPFVQEGASVKVWLPSLEQNFDGIVRRRSILATPKTRTFPVEVAVPNLDGKILPGMRARVEVPRKTWDKVVIVPRDAILQGYEDREAMVLPGDADEGHAELRRVELGPARGNDVVVTSGLNPGDRLIVKGHRSIVNGTLVRSVREAKAAPAAELAKTVDPKAAPPATAAP